MFEHAQPLKVSRPLFRPHCLRQFEKALGQSDATVEWIEVAVRHLKLKHECERGKDEGRERILKIAEIHQVKVNPINFDRITMRMAQLQLLSVYAQFENFLKCFRKEHPRMVDKSNTPKPVDGDNQFKKTIRAFGLKDTDVGILEAEIFDYYHLVRNHLVHRISEEQREKHTNKRNTILETKNERYSNLSAPNVITSLQFDDFILFTRVTKCLARNICALTTPTAKELFAYIKNPKKQDIQIISLLRSTPGKDERKKAKLAAYLHTEFGFDARGDLLNDLLLCLLAQ